MDMRIAIPEKDVSPAVMNAGLEATTRLDEQQVSRGDVPMFRDAGPGQSVIWQPEPPGAERFDHAKRVMGRGWGDCDDLAPWHAASLRVSGEDPDARAVVVRSGPNRWHAIVKRSDGTLEDPSRMAGMPYAVTVGGGDDVPPEDVCACPAVVPRIHTPGRAAVALRSVNGTWLARADVPLGQSKYALSCIGRGHLPAQSIVGAINAVLGWSNAAGVLHPKHLKRLTALAGLCAGEDEYSVASVCGVEAVRLAYPMACDVVGLTQAVVGDGSDQTPGQPLMPPNVAVDVPLVPPQVAPTIPGEPLVPPQSSGLAQAALNVVQSPRATPDQQRLAAIVHDHAVGIRPPRGSLAHAILANFATLHGPPAPGSPDDHARLLVADQAAKMMGDQLASVGVPLVPPQQTTGFDFGGFISDVGNALGSAGKAVANVVKQVAPTVATVAAVLPPPYGPAIAGAAAGLGALANAVSPNQSSSSSQKGAADPAFRAFMQQHIPPPGQAKQSTAIPPPQAPQGRSAPPGTAAVAPSSTPSASMPSASDFTSTLSNLQNAASAFGLEL